MLLFYILLYETMQSAEQNELEAAQFFISANGIKQHKIFLIIKKKNLI